MKYFNREKIMKRFLLNYFYYTNRNNHSTNLSHYYYKNDFEIDENYKYLLNRKYNLEELEILKSRSENFSEFMNLFEFRNFYYIDKSSNYLHFKWRFLFNSNMYLFYTWLFFLLAYQAKDGFIVALAKENIFCILMFILSAVVLYNLYKFLKLFLYARRHNNSVYSNELN